MRVALADCFIPAEGEQFVVLTAAGGVDGTFATISGGAFSVTCNPTDVSLTAVRLPGDFHGDGLVDLDDLSYFADCLAGPDALPAPQLPGVSQEDCLGSFDFESDDDVDLEDFAAFTGICVH